MSDKDKKIDQLLVSRKMGLILMLRNITCSNFQVIVCVCLYIYIYIWLFVICRSDVYVINNCATNFL